MPMIRGLHLWMAVASLPAGIVPARIGDWLSWGSTLTGLAQERSPIDGPSLRVFDPGNLMLAAVHECHSQANVIECSSVCCQLSQRAH